MGCAQSQVSLESQMIVLKVRKEEIQKRKRQLSGEYAQITGETIKNETVPDYIDHRAMKKQKKQQEQQNQGSKKR